MTTATATTATPAHRYDVVIIGAGMALSFFTLGAWGALYAVTPENYPTSLRATGSGWAAGVGRIASIVAPLTVPVLLGLGGVDRRLDLGCAGHRVFVGDPHVDQFLRKDFHDG